MGLDDGFKTQFLDLSVKQNPLKQRRNRLLKRTFDILFSILVVLGILSWLTPLLYVLIKVESNGNLFYAGPRNGRQYKIFACYKFRTLKPEKKGEIKVEKINKRVTFIGKILRKRSIDELPQFFNVLRGDMSVVGPRPHMVEYNKAYAKQVDNKKLKERHLILPGITGLAQVRGYRGEVKTDEDITNRINADLYYIENWTFIMDLKIIIQTFINVIKGEEKAN